LARILVIDDNAEIRQLWARVLSKAGYDVLEGFDGDDGIQQFAQNDVSLVITDWTMPRRNGGEVIQEVRRQDPSVKVILVTANSAEADLAAAQLNVQKLLTKPVALQTLLDSAEEVLSE
jgi:two-component system chemotaxis response regulator CheY